MDDCRGLETGRTADVADISPKCREVGDGPVLEGSTKGAKGDSGCSAPGYGNVQVVKQMFKTHRDLCKEVRDEDMRKKLVTSIEVLEDAVQTVLSNKNDKGSSVDRSGFPVSEAKSKGWGFGWSPFSKAQNVNVSVKLKTFPDCNMYGAEDAFVQKVHKQLSSQHFKLNVKKVEVLTDAGRDVSMLVCPITNRLGSSVDSTLRKANCTHGHQRLALLLFHHLPPHSPLPVDSDRLLTEEKYTKFGCIVDIVFWQNTGVYSCKSNDNAVHKLSEFIKEHQE